MAFLLFGAISAAVGGVSWLLSRVVLWNATPQELDFIVSLGHLIIGTIASLGALVAVLLFCGGISLLLSVVAKILLLQLKPLRSGWQRFSQ